MPFETSQGITFEFNSVVYTATSIAVSRSRGENDISTTELAAGSFRRIRAGKLNSVEIKVDWIGGTIPPVRALHAFKMTGTDLGAGAFDGKKALCTGLSISGAAGDMIKGSATFKVSQD